MHVCVSQHSACMDKKCTSCIQYQYLISIHAYEKNQIKGLPFFIQRNLKIIHFERGTKISPLAIILR
jgi:hypothetical protein